MKIALVDDQQIFLDRLNDLISKELDSLGNTSRIIDAYLSGTDFLAEWESGKYDLIILDIFMEGMNGIQVAEKIRESDNDVRLVFCTSSNEFAGETYRVEAKEYLNKPVTAEKISVMFRKLNIEHMEKTRVVRLPDGQPVLLRSILYIDYVNHKVTVYIKKKTPYSLYTSFSKIESLLKPYGFFYAPIKGVIINFYEVERLTGDSFVMKDGKVQPITRRKYKEAKEAYTKFQFRTLSQEVDI